MHNVLLRPQEVARRLQISGSTLQKMRVQGTGPKFIKLADGKNAAVRYHESDVDDYITSRLRRDSSSE
jgi:predicted DNA-binding transcriptional regulator AlpA